MTVRLTPTPAALAGNTLLPLLGKCVSRLTDILLITEARPLDHPGPRIVFVNEAFQRMTGYAPHEVIGNSPRFLQGPRTDRAELDRIAGALRRWEAVRTELVNYKNRVRPSMSKWTSCPFRRPTTACSRIGCPSSAT